MRHSESPIDERYRLMLIEHYLDSAKEVPYRGFTKWEFICPFCSPLSSKEYKRKERKGSLLWDARQNSWVFFCAKQKSVQCMYSKSLSNLISALNPSLGEAYKRDRWSAGTTGKGHNCKAPESIVGISTSTNRFERKATQQKPNT